MESKIERIMCGTCLYWSGDRECIYGKKTKVVLFDEKGKCECVSSSKFGDIRKRELKCKEYINFLQNT